MAENPGFNALFDIPDDIPDDYRFSNNLALSRVQMEMAEEIIYDLEHEQQLMRPGWIFAMQINFMRLVLMLSRAVTGKKQSNKSLFRIGSILHFISRNENKSLTPHDIAKQFNLSLRTLERLFVTTMQMTPTAYLINRKLQRAAELLQNDHTMNITEISLQSGFSDSNYFSKMFSRKFGVSPREYRRNSDLSE